MDSVKLVDICRIEKGQQIDTSRLNDAHRYRYINGGVKESGFYDSFNSNEECVLVSEGGASCGYVNYINEPFWCGCHCYRLFDLKVMPKYLYYALKANQERIMDLRTGVCMPNIKKKEFQNFVVSIDRDAKRQDAVVKALDTIQKAIDLKRKQLEDLDELVKSKFQEMFGDPVENEKGWNVKKLEEIVAEGCSISYGIVQPGDGVDDGVPVVRPVDMVNTFVFRDGLKQTTKEISNSYKRTILKGDEILLCVRGTTGMVALASEGLKDCNVTRGITPIECSESINRWFMYYQFLTEGTQHYIAERTQGIALKQINMKDVREIPFIVPPIEQQNDFAEFARKADAANAIIKQEISDLEELMDSKMDEYFG